ncbi:UBP1-associated protein 2C-like [Corylus avellana]|uniref:UBP1-associated protein 2C-like n=1 Tax=Corylus avellana TaxID=13451 RepID=UPI00286B288F|nr:UBP1-associated protein 2C-like [Corylus avellana]
MEDMKKRKLGEASTDGETSSEEEMRLLLDPLPKPQLVHLLSKLGSQYPSIAEEIRSIASADPVHRKLFVRGLAWNTTSETLCAAFLMHGEIEEGAVIYDKATGKSRGYGFITYKNMESAQSALRAPSKMIDGRLAVCNLACEGLNGASTTQDLAQRKLYIGGLSPDITSEKLLEFFGKYGDIEEGSVAYDKDTNESRGFGFVTYKTVDSAKRAIDDPNKMLGGRNIIVKLADSHKGKSQQTQLPTAVVPMALPMAAGYQQPGNAHAGTVPVGYSYPQTVASYPPPSFPSPPTAPAPYQTQPQIHYAPVNLKKDPLGLPSTPVGIGGYPYYISKQ